MIHEIGRELLAELRVQGAPFIVIDGPEPTKTVTWGRERIVLEHDDGGSDSFARPRTQSVNPKRRYTRSAAYKLTIYAQSPAPGASVFEHRVRVEKALDVAVCALELIAARRKDHFEPTGGKLVTPPELADSERPNGAAYELKFTFDRGVAQSTWAGAKRPEATLGVGGLRSTTKVSGGTGTDTDVPGSAETSCGA